MPILYSQTSEEATLRPLFGRGFIGGFSFPPLFATRYVRGRRTSLQRETTTGMESFPSLCAWYMGGGFLPRFSFLRGRRARSWTRDLRIRNLMLYHWAIPAAISKYCHWTTSSAKEVLVTAHPISGKLDPIHKLLLANKHKQTLPFNWLLRIFFAFLGAHFRLGALTLSQRALKGWASSEFSPCIVPFQFCVTHILVQVVHCRYTKDKSQNNIYLLTFKIN